jgi:hypothetical protein
VLVQVSVSAERLFALRALVGVPVDVQVIWKFKLELRFQILGKCTARTT